MIAEKITMYSAGILILALIVPAVFAVWKKTWKYFWLMALLLMLGILAGAITTVHFELKTIPRVKDLQRKPLQYWSEQKIKAMITREALAVGFPPELAIQICRQESSFKVRAVSSAQACGLFQVMPRTWIAFSQEHETDIFDPELNTRVALRFLMHLKGKNVDYKAILQKYNAGEVNWKCNEARLYANQVWARWQNSRM